MKQKIVVLIILLLLLSGSGIASSSILNYKNNAKNELDNCHLIKNVPYVAKEEGFSCDYAPIAMTLKYYGINTSIPEIFYEIGGGYAQGYGYPLKRVSDFPFRKLPLKFLCLGDLSVGGTEDYKFLASLYGCSFEYDDYNFVANKEKCWKEYWAKVQNYISSDIPVVTAVDPLSWPPYREFTNTTMPPSIFSRSCCVIVIVGFNLSNSTICFHDQYVGEKNSSIDGSYKWINISELKKAAGRAIWDMKETRYEILLIKKISDALPEDLIVELVHNRNIKKLEGLKEVYDSDFIQNNFKEYGIYALKSLKKDMQSLFIYRLPFYKIFHVVVPSLGYPFSKMIDYFNCESIDESQVVQYMKSNTKIASQYYGDIALLELEAKYWRNLTNLTIDLKGAVYKGSWFKFPIESKSIINNMVETIDNIIQIQEMIILANS